jgi:hypothetical protein
VSFEENAKTGERTLTIIGDYFDAGFVPEVLQIAEALSYADRRVYLCTDQHGDALRQLLTGRGIDNISYRAVDASHPVLTRWARDIAVSGSRDGKPVFILSPDKRADTPEGTAALRELLQQAFPERTIEVAPFVFEGGNLAFVNSGKFRVLIVGRKVLFDNEVYQRRSLAGAYDRAKLLGQMARTFHVDVVMVVGQADERPDTRLYFEYHIDMGMVILEGNRAVVSQLEFGEAGRAALAAAIKSDAPVLSRFAWLGKNRMLNTLAERLQTVSNEYEEYAEVLEGLGLEVHRSPVGWEHVVGSMSWTNVLQAGDKLLMPLYPDSVRGVTTAVKSDAGQTRLSLDVSDIDGEKFELRDDNLRNYELYQSLGYEVVPVPEYLHYMGGGLHCFVNVLQ